MFKTKLNPKLRAAMLIAATGFTVAYSASSSAADIYTRYTTVSKNLSDTGEPVAILSVTIPAGTWVVTAKANPVSFGAADYVRCRIMVGASQKDAGATLLGNAAPGPTAKRQRRGCRAHYGARRPAKDDTASDPLGWLGHQIVAAVA